MCETTSDNPADAPRGGRDRARFAFTIVELLVVIGMIVVLLSIIVVAVNAAVRTSQTANTQALLSSINKGLVQFQSDIGYLPPVLATPPGPGGGAFKASRDYAAAPVPAASEASSGFNSYIDDVQEWHSITTLAEYLLGYGDASEDGYGRIPSNVGAFPENDDDGPLGIRHPGPDGYWGVSSASTSWSGTLVDRQFFLTSDAGRRYRQGRVHGPYLELRDDRLLGAIVPDTPPNAQGQYQVYFAGDALPPGQQWDDLPKVIVDYWGQPIRYHRRPYVTGMPGQDCRRGMPSAIALQTIERVPTLSDVFLLRPYRLAAGEAIDGVADSAGDTTTSRALQSATFGLLSAGPDRRVTQSRRADPPDEYNRDNIVELGR